MSLLVAVRAFTIRSERLGILDEITLLLLEESEAERTVVVVNDVTQGSESAVVKEPAFCRVKRPPRGTVR